MTFHYNADRDKSSFKFKATRLLNTRIIHNIFLELIFLLASALECYVCSNQTDNAEKCLNTIKTCEQGEDVCLSEIRWGSQPYFSQGALKQFYVSKRCSTKALCAKTRSRYMPYCTHIWYEDWTCSECCQGDRCNYYVIVSTFMRK